MIKAITIQQTEPTLLVTVQFEIEGDPTVENYAATGVAIADHQSFTKKTRVDAAVDVIAKLPPDEKASAIEAIENSVVTKAAVIK